MKLTAKTSMHELLGHYPFLVDFLPTWNPKYKLLKSTIMRATVGRVATLAKVAEIGGVRLEELMRVIAEEVHRQTGQRLDLETAAAPAERPDKVAAMKRIIEDLHGGMPVDEARRQFDALTADVAPAEIAEMEQQLIRDGLPVSEIQRLCDLHVGVFQQALDQAEQVDAPPGHPIHTYMAENVQISRLADRLGELVAPLQDKPERLAELKPELDETLSALGRVDNHYVRKENQLFPFLERHGITGPSQVMWGVHNEIREQLKNVRAALQADDAAAMAEQGPALARAVTEMVYKENRILFPMAAGQLTEAEWAEARRGEDAVGYAFAEPAADWPGEGEEPAEVSTPAGPEGLLALATGELSLGQLDRLLVHLPVEVSFVDAEDRVRYYSDHPERLFPRSPGVIGRHVEQCHPPKSIDLVRQILDAFKSGRQDSARFWIQPEGRFILITYVAVRDRQGSYLGALEVTQDVTDIRRLEGQRRLPDWTG